MPDPVPGPPADPAVPRSAPATPGSPPRARVRAAVPEDVPEMHALIRELAEYEREPDAVVATEADLADRLFADHPALFALVAEAAPGSGRRIDGFAVWFLTYSTWEGRHGIWLEDLCVRESERGRGTGRALLAELARIAVERGYRRVEWSCLTWNEPALGLYRSVGAEPLEDWRTHRLTGGALGRLGTG